MHLREAHGTRPGGTACIMQEPSTPKIVDKIPRLKLGICVAVCIISRHVEDGRLDLGDLNQFQKDFESCVIVRGKDPVA